MGSDNPPANASLARKLQCQQTRHWRAGMGHWVIGKTTVDRQEKPLLFARRGIHRGVAEGGDFSFAGRPQGNTLRIPQGRRRQMKTVRPLRGDLLGGGLALLANGPAFGGIDQKTKSLSVLLRSAVNYYEIMR